MSEDTRKESILILIYLFIVYLKRLSLAQTTLRRESVLNYKILLRNNLIRGPTFV
jgi:hypothetical protein